MKKKTLFLSLLFLLLAGCASKGSVDPWEGFNRKVMSFNDGIDRAVLKPVAKGYRWIAPGFVETGVGNFFSNLEDPVVALNQLLQCKPGLALQDTGRFLVNTTLGIGGLFDVAQKLGLEKHQEDFGQTFSVWGIGQGPYLVVPFWGPSNPRDFAGDIISSFTFAPSYLDNVRVRNIIYGIWLINKRAQVLDAEELISGDRYLFIRDAYLQQRDYLIADGEVEDAFLD